jgi:predicted NBD/HSP70 family sugar kinase
MYLGIDIGGTKTLVAVLDERGVISQQAKFPTPKDYQDFLAELEAAITTFGKPDFKAGGIGMPATVIDREQGRGINFSNLPWLNVPMQADVERICNCPVAVENDTKLAGLSEAMLLKDKYRSVLYITVSTGIGIALVVNGVVDINIGDGGGRTLLLEHKGKMMPWEDFASGRSIVERYGKKAIDITDKATWQKISRDLAQGLVQLIAIMQPEVIIIGGSVGRYFERYGKLLAGELDKYAVPLVTMPALVSAQRPEEAVVYGCYDLAKQVYGDG